MEVTLTGDCYIHKSYLFIWLFFMEIYISLSCGKKNRPSKRPETLHRGSYWSFSGTDDDRSHVEASNRPRGNAARDALRHSGRGASMYSFPRGAWERSEI